MRFEEQLTLGDREDAPVEYLFGDPNLIETDSRGRIYIAGMNNSIRVFSPEGEYLETIGREGKGPGEFIALTAMAIGNNDELIVYDTRNFRITKFFQFGDSVFTQNLPNPRSVQRNIIPLENERFAITSLVPPYIAEYSNDYTPINNEDYVIHLMNEDFSERIHSLFPVYEYMFDENEPLEIRFATNANFRMAGVDDSTLAFTHQIYNGNIYWVDIYSDSVRKIAGQFAGQEPYELFDWERRQSLRQQSIPLVTSSSPLGSFAYQRKLESEILLANDKWILNVVQSVKNNESTFYLEFFAKHGSYLGHTVLNDDLSRNAEGYIQFDPLHLDDRDNFYFVDYSTGIPVIHVEKIILEE